VKDFFIVGNGFVAIRPLSLAVPNMDETTYAFVKERGHEATF